MENESKNNYEQKKREREKAREKERMQAQRAKMQKSIVRYGLAVVTIAVLGYGVFLFGKTAEPEGEDVSIAYEVQGRDHIVSGALHPAYNSNPPSSGWHYASPARGGFYSEQIPDEQAIHNLEHGDIWIAYHPEITNEAKDILESFAGRYVVVSPRIENDGDISLVAWGRVDTFDIENGTVDKGRIQDFITRYDNRGPENVRAVPAGGGAY